MSYFTVAVFTEPGGKTVEELLNLYKLRVPKYVVHTKEQVIQQARERNEKIRKTDYAKFLADPKAFEKTCKDPQIIEFFKNEFPQQLKWTDEEIYANETRCTPKDMIGPNGEIYADLNPNGKLISYELGGLGRYMIKLKNGLRTYKGQVKNIDFNQDDEWYQMSLQWWEINIEGREQTPDEENLVAFVEFDKERFIKRYKTKEIFAKIMSKYHTTAVITPDGVWHDKHELSDSVDDKDKDIVWLNEYYHKRFIETADPEWTLTTVWCTMF